jgi:5-methylcytosine-specific restriction endonuclease McrA
MEKKKKKRKKKPLRKKLGEQLDGLARDFIRLRDDWTCQWCKKKPPAVKIDVSHVVPRTYKRLKWEPLNLKCLCFRCHVIKWHHEARGRDWFDKEFPERAAFIEAEKAKGPKKFSLTELEELRDELIKGIERMKSC